MRLDLDPIKTARHFLIVSFKLVVAVTVVSLGLCSLAASNQSSSLGPARNEIHSLSNQLTARPLVVRVLPARTSHSHPKASALLPRQNEDNSNYNEQDRILSLSKQQQQQQQQQPQVLVLNHFISQEAIRRPERWMAVPAPAASSHVTLAHLRPPQQEPTNDSLQNDQPAASGRILDYSSPPSLLPATNTAPSPGWQATQARPPQPAVNLNYARRTLGPAESGQFSLPSQLDASRQVTGDLQLQAPKHTHQQHRHTSKAEANCRQAWMGRGLRNALTNAKILLTGGFTSIEQRAGTILSHGSSILAALIPIIGLILPSSSSSSQSSSLLSTTSNAAAAGLGTANTSFTIGAHKPATASEPLAQTVVAYVNGESASVNSSSSHGSETTPASTSSTLLSVSAEAPTRRPNYQATVTTLLTKNPMHHSQHNVKRNSLLPMSVASTLIGSRGLQARVEHFMGWMERSIEHLPNFPRLHPQECVKRSICEAHNDPSRYGAIGLMLRLLFPATSSNSNLVHTDGEQQQTNNNNDLMEYKVINKYRHAAGYGLNKRLDNNGTSNSSVCREKYEDCLVSLLDVAKNLVDLFVR